MQKFDIIDGVVCKKISLFVFSIIQTNFILIIDLINSRNLTTYHRLYLLALTRNYLIIRLNLIIKCQFSRMDSITRNLSQDITIIIIISISLLKRRQVAYLNIGCLKLGWPVEQLFRGRSLPNIKIEDSTKKPSCRFWKSVG